MDCTYGASSDPQYPVETLLLGPEYLAKRLYQLSPPEVGDNGHWFLKCVSLTSDMWSGLSNPSRFLWRRCDAGFDFGNGDGEAITVVRRRRGAEGERPDGAGVRRCEAGVRRCRGRRVVVGWLPAADGVVEPRRGGEGVAGSWSHADAVKAKGALRTASGDSWQVLPRSTYLIVHPSAKIMALWPMGVLVWMLERSAQKLSEKVISTSWNNIRLSRPQGSADPVLLLFVWTVLQYVLYHVGR